MTWWVWWAAATALASTAPWARQPIPGAAGVSVELPSPATHRHTAKASIVGRIESDSLIVERDLTAGDGWAAATVTQAPPLALRLAGPTGVADRARASILSDTEGETLTWSPTTRSGRAGMALTFRTTKDTGRPQHGRAEIYTWDGYVVTFTAVAEGDGSDPWFERFFDSIALPPDARP